MTVTTKKLIEAKFAAATSATQYTANNCLAILDKFTATNSGSANASISVHIVPVGESAGPNNEIVSRRVIVPGETYSMPGLVGHVLNPGDFISTIASSASAIVIRASGREIT